MEFRDILIVCGAGIILIFGFMIGRLTAKLNDVLDLIDELTEIDRELIESFRAHLEDEHRVVF